MNTRKQAEDVLADFMDSNEKVVLLTGTNTYQKRVLALQTLVNEPEEATILFRANYALNVGTFFGEFDISFQTGKAYSVENHPLWIDTMKETSWEKSPVQVDHAVVYPLDHACTFKEKARRQIFDDLMRRVTGKILLVGGDDQTEYEWLSDLVDRHVVYDVEEDEPAFDQTKKEFHFDCIAQKKS